MVFKSDRVTWYRPTSLDDLLTLKSTYPDAKLVVGNTEVGRNMRYLRHVVCSGLISVSSPPMVSKGDPDVAIARHQGTTANTYAISLKQGSESEPIQCEFVYDRLH